MSIKVEVAALEGNGDLVVMNAGDKYLASVRISIAGKAGVFLVRDLKAAIKAAAEAEERA